MIWNPIDSYQQRRARRRYMPRANTARTGTIAKVSMVALALILLVSVVIELSGGSAGPALAKHVRENGVAPLELIERAARGRRLVFLADVPGAPAPKQLAADAVERLGLGAGLDVVGLEVPASEQPYIDLYLNTPEENAGILLARPRAIREGEGSGNAFLEIYRRVRRVNDQLGADRRIRILALDGEDWPPQRALAPHELARLFGARDSAMQERVQSVLTRLPRARMLLFVGGLQAMASGGANIQTGGTRTVRAQWLAARLRQRFPQDVYSILVDAAAGGGRPRVAAYRGTAAGPLLEEENAPTAAVTTRHGFDFTRQPIRTVGTPGVNFELDPRTFLLRDVADAYIYLDR